jgi:hypothetical protein
MNPMVSQFDKNLWDLKFKYRVRKNQILALILNKMILVHTSSFYSIKNCLILSTLQNVRLQVVRNKVFLAKYIVTDLINALPGNSSVCLIYT